MKITRKNGSIFINCIKEYNKRRMDYSMQKVADKIDDHIIKDILTPSYFGKFTESLLIKGHAGIETSYSDEGISFKQIALLKEVN